MAIFIKHLKQNGLLDFCTKCAGNIFYIKKNCLYIIINANMHSRKLRDLLVRLERELNFFDRISEIIKY